MRVGKNDIRYEVTISDELRALMRAGSSPGAAPRGAPAPERRRIRSRDRHVFQPRKLRVDGQMPYRASASELLVVRVGDESPRDRGGHVSEVGSERLSLFLTSQGSCIAHFAAEPPSGVPVRPTYRMAHVELGSDISALVRACHRDIHAVAVTNFGPTQAAAAVGAVDLLKKTAATMERAIAPFVEML